MAACLIRRAQPEDAAALADVAGRTFALACPPHTSAEDIAEHVRTKLSAEAIAAELATAGMRYYVAQEGADFVGFAMLVADGERPAVIRSRKPLELRRIYVDEHRHGTGVAGALMRECLTHAKHEGHDLVWLGTNSENERALKFYRRRGFEIVGDRTFTVGSSIEHDHVLARYLDGAVAISSAARAAPAARRAGLGPWPRASSPDPESSRTSRLGAGLWRR